MSTTTLTPSGLNPASITDIQLERALNALGECARGQKFEGVGLSGATPDDSYLLTFRDKEDAVAIEALLDDEEGIHSQVRGTTVSLGTADAKILANALNSIATNAPLKLLDGDPLLEEFTRISYPHIWQQNRRAKNNPEPAL